MLMRCNLHLQAHVLISFATIDLHYSKDQRNLYLFTALIWWSFLALFIEIRLRTRTINKQETDIFGSNICAMFEVDEKVRCFLCDKEVVLSTFHDHFEKDCRIFNPKPVFANMHAHAAN